MKHSFILLYMLCIITVKAQIAHYNSYPTLTPTHILDDKLDDISFAYSMRVLVSDYNGPLIRLRKTECGLLGLVCSDINKDFYAGDNDIVDINAIIDWADGNNVYVRTWYDQSGLSRHAIQTNINNQPRFIYSATKPYIQGDGFNDYLDTQTNITVATNNMVDGTIATVAAATNRTQLSFGTYDNVNIWGASINGGTADLPLISTVIIFDTGNATQNTRLFVANPNNSNVFASYIFLRSTYTMKIKMNQQLIGSSTVNTAYNYTSNSPRNFYLLAASNNNFGSLVASTTAFTEFIMYADDIDDPKIEEIEEDQIIFWSL